MKPRLYTKYQTEVRPALVEKRGYKNVHQVPRIEKIVINMGVPATVEKGAIEDAVKELTAITGRKPVINLAKAKVVCEALGLVDPWDTRRVAFDRELAGRLARVLRLKAAPKRPSTVCRRLNEVFLGYGGEFRRGTFPRPGAKGGADRTPHQYYIQLS